MNRNIRLPSNGHKVHRLRGVVGGVERMFDLRAGAYRVGRVSSCDVRLPVDGVSREHALLLLTPDGLVVEDQKSRNGTFVDGRPVGRSTLPAGAELRLGPVCLRVETAAPEKLEAASVRERLPAPAESEVLDHEASTVDLYDVRTELWLPQLEQITERLLRPGGDLAGALRVLSEGFGLVGACLADWTPGGDSVVLAACGQLPELPPLDVIRKAVGGSAASGVVTALPHGEPVLSLAARFAEGREPRCLLLWGRFPGRCHSAAFLRQLVRYFDLVWPLVAEDPGRCASKVDGRCASTVEEPGPELVYPEGYLPGTSPAAIAMQVQVRDALPSRLPVLIVGETGVGKEQVARTLHLSSERREGPFVTVNCAAIPTDMLEAEMFGIGRGVATGVEMRRGKFEVADGGTLLLDEIGEMAPALQTKLLRALQDQEIQPLGRAPRKVDVRVVALTNADLEQLMAEGTFRPDLYFRLAGHVVEVPALRRAAADIPELVLYFLRHFARAAGKPIDGVTASALGLLRLYRWPGNVRELKNEMCRLACSSTAGRLIEPGMLAERIRRPRPGAESAAESDGNSLALKPRLQELETSLIREALERSGYRQVEAARLLGISRNGLANKMKRLGLGR